MKKMLRMVSCSKLLAHSPTICPISPNTIETTKIQKTNSKMPWMPAAPNRAAMTRMPIAVTSERMTTTAITPMIISA